MATRQVPLHELIVVIGSLDLTALAILVCAVVARGVLRPRKLISSIGGGAARLGGKISVLLTRLRGRARGRKPARPPRRADDPDPWAEPSYAYVYLERRS